MKAKILVSVLLFGTVSMNPVQASGIPTVDVLLNGLAASDMATKTIHYAKMIQDARDRYLKLKATVDQLETRRDDTFGIRSLGDFAFDEALVKSVPDAADMISRYAVENGVIELTARAQDIYTSLNLSTENQRCEDMEFVRAINDCKITRVKQANDQAMVLDAMDSMTDRLANIKVLMDEINGTESQKEMSALTARIGIEQANLQAESMKMDMFSKMMELQDKMHEQRVSTTNKAIFMSTNLLEPNDLEW